MRLAIEAPPFKAAVRVEHHRIWATQPILSLILQHLDPPSLLNCLLVSSPWYRSALAILYHTPRLRSSEDVLKFFACDPTLEGRERKRDGLRWAREVVLTDECVPDDLFTRAHLKRALAVLGSLQGDFLMPRLKSVRLDFSLEGWTQLLTPPILSTSSGRLRQQDAVVELLSSHSPPLIGPGLMEVFKPKTLVFSDASLPTGETHVHLTPAMRSQLLALLAASHSRQWSFERTFFHSVQPRYHPIPLLAVVGSSAAKVDLFFASLGQNSRTTAGLSLNPWDRRHLILSTAASTTSATSCTFRVFGVPSVHLVDLPTATGVTYVSRPEDDQALNDHAQGDRTMPSLTDQQVGALFYRGLGVGWAAQSDRVMRFGSVRA